MASLYTRQRSPFWWIKFRDPATGKIVRHSTEIRLDAKDGKRAARKLKLEAEMRENEPLEKRNAHFDSWVVGFLTEKYAEQPQTLKRYLGCWAWLDEYLQEKEIRVPRQLTFEDAIGLGE